MPQKNFNFDLHRAFHEIADLLSLLGENAFKIRAYRQAAEQIKQAGPVTAKNADPKKFKEIPGVGDAIAEKMMQYIRNGKIVLLEQLRASIPQPVRELLEIPHLGPKRVRDLYLGLRIKSKEDLIKKIKNNKIDQIRGFGPKLTQQILGAISTGQEKKKRHLRATVEPVARELTKILKKIKGVQKVIVAGSFRRKAPDVGDLDILVLGEKAAAAAEKAIRKTSGNLTVLASGATKFSFVLFPQNLQVDIRFVGPDSWGAALLYFTGNKDYNIMMRKVANEKGWMLNEYGLFDNKTGEQIAGKTEKEICEKLTLPWLPPEKRK